jgi:aquaporin Z
MAYTIGPISGCHINPAVTFGLWLAKRFPGRDVLPYWIAQVLGAIAAAAVLYYIASGKPGFTAGQFASNGYGALSPGGYGMASALIAEIVLTFAFLMVILGSTDRRAPVGFAGLAIGLVLTLIHLISIPIDNTSVNPARSTGPAIFAGAAELSQLWLFWIAPLVGGGLAGLLYPALFGEEVSKEPIVGDTP